MGEGIAIKLLVDRTAGRLGRWLRILGFDVEYVATCDVSVIARIARQTGRKAVTRTRSLAERLGTDSILLESEHLEDQIRQVVEIFGRDACEPFSRCNICNAVLEDIAKEEVKGRVPQYVYDTHDEFAVCPVCGRYYWRGTHWQEMTKRIDEILGGCQDA